MFFLKPCFHSLKFTLIFTWFFSICTQKHVFLNNIHENRIWFKLSRYKKWMIYKNPEASFWCLITFTVYYFYTNFKSMSKKFALWSFRTPAYQHLKLKVCQLYCMNIMFLFYLFFYCVFPLSHVLWFFFYCRFPLILFSTNIGL